MQQPTKYPDGFSAPGSGAAEHLRRSMGPPYQRKIAGDGSVAIRNGDLFTVIAAHDQDVAAVYSVGRSGDNECQVRGAANAAGAFGLVGAPVDGVSLDPNIRAYGLGLMESVRLVASDTPLLADFNGGQWLQGVFEVLRSRRGIDAEPYVGLDVITNNILTGQGAYVIQFALSGYRDVSGTPTFYSGLCVAQMGAGGNPVHVFVRDDGAGGFAAGATLGYSAAITYYASATTLAPGVLLKFDRYFRLGAPYTAADVLVITKSNDGGATWAVAPTPTLFAAELATVNSLANSGTDPILAFNAAANWVRVITAPLSRATSVVVAVVPYIVGANTLRARVKMGTVDSATGAIVGSVTLLDDTTVVLADAFVKDLVAIPEGVLLLTRKEAADVAGIWSEPARVQMTVDGVNLTDVGYLPLPENRTGQVRALSARRLIVPVYDDGAHRLLSSVDGGATWMRRAVISNNSRPPQPSEQFQNLADFADVVFPRLGDRPANPLPATPWLTDIRIDHA
jgi:hypothetical protein